jgi:hypothetical protein
LDFTRLAAKDPKPQCCQVLGANGYTSSRENFFKSLSLTSTRDPPPRPTTAATTTAATLPPLLLLRALYPRHRYLSLRVSLNRYPSLTFSFHLPIYLLYSFFIYLLSSSSLKGVKTFLPKETHQYVYRDRIRNKVEMNARAMFTTNEINWRRTNLLEFV